MLVAGFVAQMYATNCWVLATGEGNECIVIDPGMPDVSLELDDLLTKHRLKPVATLLTHGHLDHTFSVAPICDGYGIPAYIHSEDRNLLLDPAAAVSAEFAEMLAAMTFTEPKLVKELKSGEEFELVGLKIKVIHSPGHTRGSLMFLVDGETLLSGDVLFAGSIGRTDLPTGSHEDMQKTLSKKVLTLNDEIRVLPGHGPETKIGYERKNNPYLIEVARASRV
ncbi:GloB Zn-dependent hydrolases, including glyoxylases [Candidatus Nanopelagicaceae bacterium]